jgi:aspartyl-tRNA(Asn)/glutamyl-tRNA(Gln) amidotransferase subunit C
MSLDKNTIEKTMQLAHLELSADEKSEFTQQLSDILSYVAKINELDTSAVEPTDHIADLKNVFRNDTVIESIDTSEIEKIAPEFTNGHIVVPQIIDGDA